MSKGLTVVTKPLKNKEFIIPGTHSSSYNSLLLTSTGIPSFDSILGGGIPIGSVLLVEEDLNNRFSKLTLKYFIAEGIACGHGVCAVKEVAGSESLKDDLPKLIKKDIDANRNKKSEDMKIAFRYNGLASNQKAISDISKQGHYYDITKKMDSMMLDSCDVTEVVLEDYIPSCWEEEDIFRFALTALKGKLSDPIYAMPEQMDPNKKVNIMRIVIPSFGSPFWCSNGSKKSAQSICRFLVCLRGIIRNSMAVCAISVPTQLYTESNLKMFRHMTDCSVHLKSFAGEKKNKLFKQYHGLFKVKKLPCLNALTAFVPETLDLAFELRRTKFVIEYLHLPPDVGEAPSRQGGVTTVAKGSPCGGGAVLPSGLDF